MDTVFYIFGKIVWILASPEVWPIYALILAAWIKSWAMVRWTIVVVLIVTFVPIGNPMLSPLQNRFTMPQLDRVDGILILGGIEDPVMAKRWNQPVLSDSAERILAGLALAKKYPEAKLVFTGRHETLMSPIAETQLGADILALADLPDARFMREGESRSTYENALLSKQMISPNADENWVLITSAWHMPRAVGVFCKADWATIPFPVDYRGGKPIQTRVSLGRHLTDLGLASKEWLGLFAYWVTGKTDRLFPKDCSS